MALLKRLIHPEPKGYLSANNMDEVFYELARALNEANKRYKMKQSDIIRKEFAHVLRDRKTRSSCSDAGGCKSWYLVRLTSEVKDARIVIMDQANDAASRQIISR